MPKHFFDQTTGDYLGMMDDESLSANDVYGRTDIDTAIGPVLDVDEQLVVTWAAGPPAALVIDQTSIDSAHSLRARQLDSSIVTALLCCSMTILVRISDGDNSLTTYEQDLVDWMRDDCLPYFTMPTADEMDKIKSRAPGGKEG